MVRRAGKTTRHAALLMGAMSAHIAQVNIQSTKWIHYFIFYQLYCDTLVSHKRIFYRVSVNITIDWAITRNLPPARIPAALSTCNAMLSTCTFFDFSLNISCTSDKERSASSLMVSDWPFANESMRESAKRQTEGGTSTNKNVSSCIFSKPNFLLSPAPVYAW